MRFLLVSLVGFILGAEASALPIDWKVYFRMPVGSNVEGGKQYNLANPGTHGNEFRLGNEVAYGESYFNAHLLPGSGDAEFFDMNLTVAYNPQMDSQYGGTTSGTETAQIVQAFVKGGNFDGMKVAYWAGKRFYRDVDLHMDDFFYFADMSGVGGGVEAIPMGNGNLAVALLQHSDNSLQGTTNGVPTKQAIDIRWRDIKLSENNILHGWLAAAYTAPGSGFAFDKTTSKFDTPTDYEASHGVAVGARWRHMLDEKSYNDFAVMYGTGAMDSFNMDNSVAYAPTGTHVNKRKRTRVVENPIFDFDRWSLSVGLIYEDADNGLDTNSHSRWLSAGVRPIYYVTDHFHLVLEAGHSSIKIDSETGTGGATAGERTLDRVTFAPEVAIGKGYFARPVIRAYVTHSWWNKANQDVGNTSVGGGSLIGNLNSQGITALNGKTDETQVGMEAEIWF